MTWPILATANRPHTSRITWRTQQYWCVHRPASKEVRHLKEKSSRGFRFLRHRHKHKVLLQELNSCRIHPNGTLRHQWTQEPDNCDKQTVISVPMAERQKQNAVQRTDLLQKQSLIDLDSKEIHLRNQKSDGSQQKLKAIKQRSDTTNHWHASNGSSHCKLTIWQASSQNTQHCKRSTSETKSEGPQQRALLPDNSDETQQSMSLMKTPGRWSTNKKLTASKDRTPNCCTDAASTQTVDSIQYATSETWSTSKL